jgi:hypothetical protein
MFRVVLEGPDAEKYIEWRNRNGELAKENLALKGEVKFLKEKMDRLSKQPKLTLVCDHEGNLLDVKSR